MDEYTAACVCCDDTAVWMCADCHTPYCHMHAWQCRKCGSEKGMMFVGHTVIKAMQQYVAEMETAHSWRPIDTAPLSVDVLVSDGNLIYIAHKDDDEWRDDDYFHFTNLTHWMPLPEKPQ